MRLRRQVNVTNVENLYTKYAGDRADSCNQMKYLSFLDSAC